MNKLDNIKKNRDILKMAELRRERKRLAEIQFDQFKKYLESMSEMDAKLRLEAQNKEGVLL